MGFGLAGSPQADKTVLRQMAHDVFISYSSQDKTVADAACSALEAARIRCWMAPRDILAGPNYSGQITRAVTSSKVLLLVFSEHSNRSLAVHSEVELAAGARVHIVNFRIDATPLGDDLRFYLQPRHWINALASPEKHHHAQLVKSLQVLLDPLSASGTSVPTVPARGIDGASPTSSGTPAVAQWRGCKRKFSFYILSIVLGLAAISLVAGLWSHFPSRGGDVDTLIQHVATLVGSHALRSDHQGSTPVPTPPVQPSEPIGVSLSFLSRETDYDSISFSLADDPDTWMKHGQRTQPIPFGDSRSDQPIITLPPGVYTYWLYGPGQQDDTHIIPFRGSVTAGSSLYAEIKIPASFAGKFQGEFDDDKSYVHVVRTIVIKSGLSEGYANDSYYVNNKLLRASVINVPLAEIHLDAEGILRMVIRYAALADSAQGNFDEVVELKQNSSGEVQMTSGREVWPNDPVLIQSLLHKFKSDCQPRVSARPGEVAMRRLEY